MAAVPIGTHTHRLFSVLKIPSNPFSAETLMILGSNLDKCYAFFI